jgi:hypothetical protein
MQYSNQTSLKVEDVLLKELMVMEEFLGNFLNLYRPESLP